MKKGLKAIQYTYRIFLLLSGVIIFLTGCGDQGPSVSISVSPDTINFDESAILTWSSHDADSISINNGVGTVEERGTTVVKPYRTTTYTISAVNADGTAESSVTVNVEYTGPEPEIQVSANPTTIYPGESSVLTWSTINADTLSINNGIGNVPLNYSRTVSPEVTTTYVFIAYGPGGEATSRVTINVMSDPPTAEITANPTNIKQGGVSLLEWSYTNADTVIIEPDIGDGTQFNSKEVSPITTTTYTISAIGPGGTATDKVTIIVSDDPMDIFVRIEAKPSQIYAGNPSELSWTTRHATHVWIEPDIGDVELTGKMTVYPQQTTTYTIYATLNGHDAQDSVTINVAIPEPPVVSISAIPSKIQPNETATLSWGSQNADTLVIDQGIGEVPGSGSKEVSPLETTTYTIQATGAGGSSSASVTIIVEDILSVPLGNQQFNIENAIQVDPLASNRLSLNLSIDTDALLSENIDWSNQIPAVQHQKTTGSGNAWAMVYYLKSFQESISKQHAVHENMFSPMYTYVHQCNETTEPWDLIKTWKVTQQYGCALWSSLPFEDLDGFMDETEIAEYANYPLNNLLTSEALKYRMGSPIMLTDLGQIRMMLTQSPVVLAINHYDPTLPEIPVSNDQNFLTYSDQSDVGHAVLCIGYDNKKFNDGALKIINSWGQEWAQQGMSWIKYADVHKIVVSALAFHSLPGKPTSRMLETNHLEKPQNVHATTGTGPFVDIQWSHVTNAQYYQIYRAPAASLSTLHEVYDYEYIGSTLHSPYRDYPAASDSYLYAVVAVNELDSSDHVNHFDETEPHIAKGMASGTALKTPSLSIAPESTSGPSEFHIAEIDQNTSRIQVFVSHNEYGPWQTLGWIHPLNKFIVDWHRDNVWTGYQPYVRVVAEKQSLGFSMASRAEQVAKPIEPQNQMATVSSLEVQTTDIPSIQLKWTLTGDNVEYLDIWRTFDIQSSSPIWIKLDTVLSTLNSYEDTTVHPGINYRYDVHCVFEGVSGIGQKSNMIQLPLNQPNLRIVHVEYDTGALMEPFEMELTVENNGNSTIEDYQFQIMAYNWSTHAYILCLEDRISNYPEVKHPVAPGSQHIFSITFDLPEQLNSGVLFSWYIMIDSAHAINEAYESDNTYWAQKMCWMEMGQ